MEKDFNIKYQSIYINEKWKKYLDGRDIVSNGSMGGRALPLE